jgi:hypothetical protein
MKTRRFFFLLVTVCSIFSCSAQKGNFSSESIKLTPFQGTSDWKVIQDKEIQETIALIDTLDRSNMMKQFEDGIVFFSAQLLRDQNYKFAAIGYNAGLISYVYQNNTIVNLGKQTVSGSINNDSPQYKEFSKLVERLPIKFFKQEPFDQSRIQRMKERKSVTLFIVKKHGEFTSGVFTFDGSQYKNDDPDFPSPLYRELLLWIALNCQ